MFGPHAFDGLGTLLWMVLGFAAVGVFAAVYLAYKCCTSFKIVKRE